MIADAVGGCLFKLRNIEMRSSGEVAAVFWRRSGGDLTRYSCKKRRVVV